jgi:hypothetical protein
MHDTVLCTICTISFYLYSSQICMILYCVLYVPYKRNMKEERLFLETYKASSLQMLCVVVGD